MRRALFPILAALAATPLEAVAQVPTVEPWYQREDRGVEAQALVGVLVYPGAASDFLGTGLAYGVVVSIEPWHLWAFELSYQGALYETVSIDSPVDLSVFENGGQAALKFSPRLERFEPYALAGFGITAVDVVEEANVRSAVADDTLLLLPIALGLDYHFSSAEDEDPGEAHLMVGARAAWNFVFDNDLVPVSARGADRLIFSALFGAQF
ncbi:hypothetical protein [Vulgatibacter sp.]|uniref:hypothetical protein n=1 Tax=Vulgatibacter sp. TaxID=1971226 RepID=UPI003568590B